MGDREANIETLVSMGFTREKAELGLNKTQNRDLQSALDWYNSNGYLILLKSFVFNQKKSFVTKD